MDSQQQLTDSILVEIRDKQKQGALRFVLASLALVILGIVVLVFFSMQVKSKLDQLEVLSNQLAQTKEELRVAEEAVKIATDLRQSVVEVNLSDVKNLGTRQPQASELLLQIFDNKEIKWHLGGSSPTEGFDSPGFAAFVLRTAAGSAAFRSSAFENPSVRQQLLDNLPKVEGEPPRSGDLLFYEGGFCMFYFRIDNIPEYGYPDRPPKEFVIGMTPLGVIALSKNFAKRKDIRRPPM